MIRRKLLIATAIIASVAITACSDMTAPKKLVPRGLPGAALLAPHAVAGLAATVVATINGGGTAEMQAPLAAGNSSFGMGVKLLSDGSATGHFDCVDHHGDSPGFPGNIFGEVTSWSL
jgi:heme A synthase